MEQVVINTMVVNAFASEEFEIETIYHYFQARNYGIYGSRIINCTKKFGKRLSRVEMELSGKIGRKVFLDVNVRNGIFTLVILNASFSSLSFEDASARADISEMNLPVILGEEENDSVFVIDLARISNLLVVKDHEHGKHDMLQLLERTLVRENSRTEVCMFGVNLITEGIYCNNSEFHEFALKSFFKGKLIDGLLDFYIWLLNEFHRRLHVVEDAGAFDGRSYKLFTGKTLPYFVLILEGVEKIAQSEQAKKLIRMTHNLCVVGGFGIGIHSIILQNFNGETGDKNFSVDTLAKGIPARLVFKLPENAERRLFETKRTAYMGYSGEAIFYNATEKQLIRLQTPSFDH